MFVHVGTIVLPAGAGQVRSNKNNPLGTPFDLPAGTKAVRLQCPSADPWQVAIGAGAAFEAGAGAFTVPGAANSTAGPFRVSTGKDTCISIYNPSGANPQIRVYAEVY